jgi:glucosamine kinase
MQLYLGIDGGGTKTECAISDGSNVLGRFADGSCKMQRVGREAAMHCLQAAVRGALLASQCNANDVKHACVGLSGASDPQVEATVKLALQEVLSCGVTVFGDHIIAFESAFQGGPGVLVISGTGSIAYGRNERGETARAGGWGPVVSDEGSGDWIGRTAVAAILRAHDSGVATSKLLGRITDIWQTPTREDIVRRANGYPPPHFSSLAPEVRMCAEKGDSLAQDVMTRAGTELALLAKIVMRRLWPGDQVARVAIAGGVLCNSTLLRKVMQNVIKAERTKVVFDPVPSDPVLGAVYLAKTNELAKSN